MINNYFTLKALTDEIRDDVVSSEIEACYTRIDHTLELILGKNDSQPLVLVISCKPRANYMFMRSAPRRYTGANVMHGAVGLSAISVNAVENERSVVLSLSGGKSLLINLFGPHANVYLVGSSGEIEDTFLRKRKKPEQKAVVERLPSLTNDLREFIAAFNDGSGSPLQRLTSLIPPFAGDLGKEAFYRAGGDEAVRAAKNREVVLDQDKVEKLHEIVSEMLQELLRPHPRVYYDGDTPVTMSLIDMSQFGSLRTDSYESVNMCISAYSVNAERHENDVEIKHAATERLVREKEELTKTIAKIEKDLSGNREMKYRRSGDVIMANLGAIGKGDETFSDRATGDKIKLDPGLTAVQNAQQYFEKSKKARGSYRQALSRKERLNQSLVRVETELRKLESGVDRKRLATLARTEKARESAQTPFREFETNGYKIYVGKDAKNNDRLTFGFAKPNDIFLHARGVSGSHVIIRNKSREYPQKAVVEYAARIAAHYSKARTSGIVPVAYTMRKFVKKAKGQPGAVLVDREEVVFVKPGIPQDTR